MSIQHKFVRDPQNYLLEERTRSLNATRAPSNTFLCKGCGQSRGLDGCKFVNGKRVCKACASPADNGGGNGNE